MTRANFTNFAAIKSMADREVMAKLFEATTDDDSKVPEATAKAIVKAACKSKNEAALRDMAQWLTDRLEKSDSCTVKIKVLRVLMQIMSQSKATTFTRIFAELGADAVEQTVSFSCEPDPVHGEKPAEYVRSTATKCLRLLPAKGDGSSGGSSGGGGAASVSVVAGASTAVAHESDSDTSSDTGGIKKRVEARAREARAKAEEAKLRVESAAAEARAKAEAAAQSAKAVALESIDAVSEQQQQDQQPEPEPADQGDDEAGEGSYTPTHTTPESNLDVTQPREEILKLSLGSSGAYAPIDRAQAGVARHRDLHNAVCFVLLSGFSRNHYRISIENNLRSLCFTRRL